MEKTEVGTAAIRTDANLLAAVKVLLQQRPGASVREVMRLVGVAWAKANKLVELARGQPASGKGYVRLGILRKSRRLARLKAPFPWFGCKSAVAEAVWERFGEVVNYVEPFFGSGAVLLARPTAFYGPETINDADGLVCNFWRAVKADPEAVARHADWPAMESDLHARHAWLVGNKASLQARLEGDPEWFDARVAGWWAWGRSCWIGSGFCTGQGPWRVVENGEVRVLVRTEAAGQPGIRRQCPNLSGLCGVRRVEAAELVAWVQALAERLGRVQVCCGDWSRVCGMTPTVRQGLTAVFLDPPYSDDAGRCKGLYGVDDPSAAAAARQWAVENGDNPDLRIALCGFSGAHEMPDGWTCCQWLADGGFGSQGDGTGRVAGLVNRERERIWFSRHCLAGKQVDCASNGAAKRA